MFQINPTSNEITQLVPKTFKELWFTEVAHLQEWIAKMPESLGEEFYSFRPKGASYVSLGQRPRKDQPISQALKGRSNAGRRLRNIKSPFQGLCSWGDRIPRVSPWASIGDTVGVYFNSPRRTDSLEVKLRPNGATYASLGQRPNLKKRDPKLRPNGASYVSLGQRPNLKRREPKLRPNGATYVSLGQRPNLKRGEPKFRPKGASYVSLGQRPRKDKPINQALKGRSKSCLSLLQKTRSTSCSRPKKENHLLKNRCAQTSMHIWQRFLKIWNAQPSLSTRLMITFTSSFYSTVLKHFQTWLQILKRLLQNGLKHNPHHWNRFHGKQGLGRSPLASLISQRLKYILRNKKNIIGRLASKMSCGAFLTNMGSTMMNAISGIKSPFQGLFSWVGRLPRVSPWADIGDTVGVWGRRCVGMMFPKMEMVSFETVFLEATFKSEIEAVKRT